jgi:hypothetical protein
MNEVARLGMQGVRDPQQMRIRLLNSINEANA